MKRTLKFIILFLCSFQLVAQNVSNTLEVNEEHLQLLLEAAISNSEDLKQANIQMTVADYNRRRATNEWLGLIAVGGNLNEISIKQFGDDPSEQQTNNFFPRYNFGIRVPLSMFGEISAKKKIIEQEKLLINSQSSQVKRSIEEQVKKLYFNYLKAKQSLSYKNTIDQYMTANFNIVEQNFSEGSITLDEYYKSRTDYYNFKIQVVESENQYLHAKSELETIINTSLASLGIE